jgi:hypothetical protein
MHVPGRMATRALLALAFAVVTSGCEGLKDLSTVYTALGEHFHEPMNVNINNGSHLIITLVNAPESALDDAGREAYARDIAAFAKSRWPHPGALDDITVAYSSQSSTGPLTVTRSNGVYRWTVAQLPDAPADSARDSAAMKVETTATQH